MLNKIPWYVALFQSLPESFFILKLGLILFRIDIDVKDSSIIASIVAIFSYLIRKYFVTFGLHTIITMILLIILAKVIGKIKIIHSIIGVFMGVLITGALQSATVPWLLSVSRMQISDLAIYPILNIVFFIPCALIMLLMYLFVKRKNFYLFDLNMNVEE